MRRADLHLIVVFSESTGATRLSEICWLDASSIGGGILEEGFGE